MGVLDHVMQQRGLQALRIHVHVGEDLGNGQGMNNVGIAAAAVLAFVGVLGKVIGATHVLCHFRRQIVKFFYKGFNCLHVPNPSLSFKCKGIGHG